MSTKPDLPHRRQMLLSRAAEQRRSVAMQTQLLASPLARIDQGMFMVKNFKSHPIWVAGILVAIALITPRRLVAAMRSTSNVSRVWHQLQPIVARLRR